MILRVIVFMEWFWGIFMEWSGKFKDLRFRYVKKTRWRLYGMSWLVKSKKGIFFIECISLVQTSNRNQAFSHL